MHDLKAIRENPEKFDANWARRGLEPQTPNILSLDEKRRRVQTSLQQIQAERNEKSQKIGQIKREGGDAQAIMDEVAGLKDKMADLEEQERTLAAELDGLLAGLPNLMADDVPDGASEDDNQVVLEWGDIALKSGPDHAEIGETLKGMDFETAAKISGARFTLLYGDLARLERALGQFMLDKAYEHGFTHVSPPLLVRDNALFGTSQLPKFEEDQFKTTRGDYLIPTSEVPVTNIVADSILSDKELPLRFTALTPCFRSEAGAAGKDTRGMLRQHQFWKVEMVSITLPEESDAENERMAGCAEAVLQALNLPYRKVKLCTGDTGFGARRTYDLEVWLPGQEAYREISSCSTCADFQARRMKARFRRDGEKQTEFVHTLNGSGVAVGRALIAVIENYWDAESKTLRVPEVLVSYMAGQTEITAKA